MSPATRTLKEMKNLDRTLLNKMNCTLQYKKLIEKTMMTMSLQKIRMTRISPKKNNLRLMCSMRTYRTRSR